MDVGWGRLGGCFEEQGNTPAGGAHCCLQADRRRSRPLALRAGVETALALRSARARALNCADSVPFMHTTLGRPRLCPFWPAPSSGTCPRRDRTRGLVGARGLQLQGTESRGRVNVES